ncbi:MAG: flagellar synthesis regulator FleN [Syntrophus sp. (in: bacteria)]|nr:flagellar synthesis regulator FleN [Syntrophus sp. (in: bacteria)]
MVKNGRKTITVTSGKGGVGKSSIVSNMAYLLGNMDKSTFILDADLSLGNIDIMFGMHPKYNVKDLIDGTRSIEEVIAEGPCGIKIIPATSGISEFSHLSENERKILFASIQGLPKHDILIIDTSAGISSNVVYFNAMSENIFVVITPDPASITDSYAVIKVLHKKTGRKDFNVIVNMVKDEEEALEIYKQILNVTDRFLDVYLDYFGYIPIDKNVNIATRKQKLWVERFPDTHATKALMQICNRLVS